MYLYVRNVCVGGAAVVATGVGLDSPTDEEVAAARLRLHCNNADPATLRVVVHHRHLTPLNKICTAIYTMCKPTN